MASQPSPAHSPTDELDSDHGDEASDDEGQVDRAPDDPTAVDEKPAKPLVPTQKRRRVTRACDECRRKKIKCDGKQPCTHCTVYSYECTYDQPSNRRRNPAPQYIEALEARLHKAEAILRVVAPGIDLDDAKYDARSIDQIIQSTKEQQPSSAPPERVKPDDEGQLQTMVSQTGSLDLDDRGHWDFHGHSSGYAFMRKFNSQFGDSFVLDPRMPIPRWRPNRIILESPKSVTSSPQDAASAGSDLPPREVAIELCRNCIDDCCALMRHLHRPTFFRRLHKIYDTDPDHYTNADIQFLPQLYVAMAVGCMFAKTEHENTMLDVRGYQEAMEQGYQYFNTARQMIDITDCRDLMSLQAIVFMIIFLQSTAKLSTCYAYIGIALRACCRLGLHRNVHANFNNIEREERKRLFWLVRKLDAYVGAALGLPQMLSDDDIDQELPAEVDDDYILADGMRPMPPNVVPLIKATNAHTRLTHLLRKVVRYIYPIKRHNGISPSQSYSISHHRIMELERDLQQWMDALPPELRPSEDTSPETARVQQLLRMSYAHVQMMMYRPFIHNISRARTGGAKADKRSYACAAACVSVARNIVHITTEMKKRGLLVGAYWFVMYTTYFAILSLVFMALENPDNPTGQAMLKDAMEGRDTLASLAKRSLAADRCTVSLNSLFNDLPDKLQARRSSIDQSTSKSKKRSLGGRDTLDPSPHQSVSHATSSPDPRNGKGPVRTRTLPRDWLTKVAKRNSMPDPSLTSPYETGTPWSSLHSPQTNAPSFGTGSEDTSPPFTRTDPHQLLANSSISDMNNVMFPTDDPFAYPNQPISTLEDSHYTTPDQTQDSFSLPSTEKDAFDGSRNIHPGPRRVQTEFGSFDGFNAPAYNASTIPAHLTQGRHYSSPLSVSQTFEVPQTEEPASLSGMPIMNQHPPGGYWSQGGPDGMRVDLTMGGVNLAELFGGDSWSMNTQPWGAGATADMGDPMAQWKHE